MPNEREYSPKASPITCTMLRFARSGITSVSCETKGNGRIRKRGNHIVVLSGREIRSIGKGQKERKEEKKRG